jgi:hypothetical protein
MAPEWEGVRKAWMENYQLGHPLDKVEAVERLSGMEGAKERNEQLR